MSKPSFTPTLKWVADASGQMTSEAQRILRALIDITFNRTGLEGSAVVTGTAGTANHLSKWDANGDLIDAGNAGAVMTLLGFPANSQSLVTAANYAAMRALLDLEAGTDFYSISGADAAFQPKDADLTSWAAITRASGFDTFVATPSSANFASLLTDESGTAGAVPFIQTGTFTPAFAATGATFSYAGGGQSGTYAKIGSRVLFAADIVLNTSGNTLTANALTVTGLPFSATDGSGIFPVRFDNSTTSYVAMTVRISGTTLVVEGATAAATTNAGAVASNAALHATNGTSFRVKGFFAA